MKNLLKEVEGNIYGMGIYCFKDIDNKVLYVGSGMMNDRLQSHLYNLKRGLYENNNKKVLQHTYNCGNLTFEVLHFSENNATYLNGTNEERKAIQKSLETLEQFYIDLYKDTICNSHKKVTKTSSSPNILTTYKRRKANIGSKNPNARYSEKMIAEILWLKQNGYKAKEISKIIEDNYKIDVKKTYMNSIGVYKWIHIDAKYSSWMDKYIE